MMKGPAANAKSQIASPTPAPTRPPPPPPVVPQPIVATAAPAAATATVDPTAQKKAFEDAVNQKLQEEMLKMQSQFDKQMQTKESKNDAGRRPTPGATPSVG